VGHEKKSKPEMMKDSMNFNPEWVPYKFKIIIGKNISNPDKYTV